MNEVISTDVFVYGETGTDNIIQVPYLPAPERAACILSDTYHVGGVGANVAVFLSHWGLAVRLSGNALGDDEYGRRARAGLDAFPNLDLTYLETLPGVRTPFWRIMVTPDGERTQLYGFGDLSMTPQQACARLQTPSRVYLVACGDGLSAALAASFTWERILGCPVEAVPAMTFSRYTVENAPPGALAVVISQSGKVIRVIEALACAQRRGLETLVVTNKPESPLAGLVPEDHVFKLGFTRLGFTPGASAYTYTLAALYELVAAMGRNSGLAQELHQQLDQTPQAVATAVKDAWQPAGEFARKLNRKQVIINLGSGQAYGTAHYTMRKVYEICQSKAALLETEEYAHDAFYALDADTPTILFAPPDAGFRRCAEVAGYLSEVGCPLLIVSGAEKQPNFPSPGISFAGLPGASAVETTITYAVAAQALACQAGRLLGGAFYACNNPTRYARGDEQIYESSRMDLEDE